MHGRTGKKQYASGHNMLGGHTKIGQLNKKLTAGVMAVVAADILMQCWEWLLKQKRSIQLTVTATKTYSEVLRLHVVKVSLSFSSSGILLFFNSRSMTPITWQAAVDDKEQRPLLQDILEAAVDDWWQAEVDVEEQRPQLRDMFEAAIDGNHV